MLDSDRCLRTGARGVLSTTILIFLTLAGCGESEESEGPTAASATSASSSTTASTVVSTTLASTTSLATTTTGAAPSEADQTYLAALTARGGRVAFTSDQSAVAFGKRVCDELRQGRRFAPAWNLVDLMLGALTVTRAQVPALEPAVGVYCPEFADLVRSLPQ